MDKLRSWVNSRRRSNGSLTPIKRFFGNKFQNFSRIQTQQVAEFRGLRIELKHGLFVVDHGIECWRCLDKIFGNCQVTHLFFDLFHFFLGWFKIPSVSNYLSWKNLWQTNGGGFTSGLNRLAYSAGDLFLSNEKHKTARKFFLPFLLIFFLGLASFFICFFLNFSKYCFSMFRHFFLFWLSGFLDFYVFFSISRNFWSVVFWHFSVFLKFSSFFSLFFIDFSLAFFLFVLGFLIFSTFFKVFRYFIRFFPILHLFFDHFLSNRFFLLVYFSTFY